MEKSKFYFGKGVSHRLETQIRDLRPLNRGFRPLTYLGVPLFTGRPKKAFLLPLSDKIKARLAQWNGKSLSMVGRLTLVKSVISGAFTHSFFICKWSRQIIKE